MDSSYIVNVHGQYRGSLIQQRTAYHSDGLFLTVKNEPVISKQCQTNGFARATMNPSGSQIAAVDYYGNIFVFNVKRNRFWHVLHLDRCCSSIAFITRQKTDLIVASSDCSLSFLNTETCSIVKSVHVHSTCVSNISINETGDKAISSSLEKAIIWDLATLSILNTLNIKTSGEILKVFFLSAKSYIVSAFKGNSVFLWRMDNLTFVNSFVCEQDDTLWLRTIDASSDGAVLICGGRSNVILIWSVEHFELLYTLSLARYLSGVRQITFLTKALAGNHLSIFVLSSDGALHMFDLTNNEHVYKLGDTAESYSFVLEYSGKVLGLTSSSELKVYNLKNAILESKKPKSTPKAVEASNVVEAHEKPKKKLIERTSIYSSTLRSILRKFGEYPIRYRNLIWSQLLELPKNPEYIAFYTENDDDPTLKLIFQNYPISDPKNQKYFIRVFSMLVEWCNVLKEINYIPFLVFPFIKAFTTNVHLCFELLVTYICNWCQNWFFYLPFPPFNILCSIENLLLYHDRTLLHHFLMHDISPFLYAFTLLQTSFSDVFSKDDWFQLWDHIISNSPVFLLYVVAAFNIVCRKTLLNCSMEEEFKIFFSKRSALVSSVIHEAYHLQKTTPACFEPTPVIGDFQPLPKGGYPIFNRFTLVQSNLDRLQQQFAIDSEIDHLRHRKEKLVAVIIGDARLNTATSDIHEKNLKELGELQELRKKLILASMSRKETKELSDIEDRLHRVQESIHHSLVDQVTTFNKKIAKSWEKSTQSGALKDSSETRNEILKLREKLSKENFKK